MRPYFRQLSGHESTRAPQLTPASGNLRNSDYRECADYALLGAQLRSFSNIDCLRFFTVVKLDLIHYALGCDVRDKGLTAPP